MSFSAEEKKRYFAETAIALRREGFRVEPSVGGRLGVWLDEHPLCEVDQIGGITYRSDNIPTSEYVAAKDKAYRIVCNTAEYMRQMEQAPPLKVSDLPDRYKVLADFKEFYIFRTVRPNSMSQKAGSEYEEAIITNYDPRRAIWQLSLENLLGDNCDTRYELMHEPEKPLKQTNYKNMEEFK